MGNKDMRVVISAEAALKLREVLTALTQAPGFKGRGPVRQPEVLDYVRVELFPYTRTATFFGTDRYLMVELSTQASAYVNGEPLPENPGTDGEHLLHAITLRKALGVVQDRHRKADQDVEIAWSYDVTGSASKITVSTETRASNTPYMGKHPSAEAAILSYVAKGIVGSVYPTTNMFPTNDDWRDGPFGHEQMTLSGPMLVAQGTVIGSDDGHVSRFIDRTKGTGAARSLMGVYVTHIDHDAYTVRALFMPVRHREPVK